MLHPELLFQQKYHDLPRLCKKLDFSFQQYGYELIIVNTGKGHASLGREYSDIPLEMKETAAVLGAGHLGETSLEKLLENLPAITNDRAALRAFHFFEENRRVTEAANAIQAGSMKPLLALMEESGHSSWEWLQNCYCPQNPKDQKISLALALTRLFLRRIGTAAISCHPAVLRSMDPWQFMRLPAAGTANRSAPEASW